MAEAGAGQCQGVAAGLGSWPPRGLPWSPAPGLGSPSDSAFSVRASVCSTAASECDLPLPAPAARLSPGRAGRPRESNAWTWRRAIGVGSAFAGGNLLGAMAVCACAVMLRPSVPVPAAQPQGAYAMAPAPNEVPPAYMAAVPLNNSCLISQLRIPHGPQGFDACAFVVKSTDEVWNLRGDVEAAIDKYFHEGYLNAGSWGRRGVGIEALKRAVFAEMRAFPDIRIHITDCVCRGNDFDGYKCSMPDVLTGTNLGPSAYGPATGRKASWTGMVESLVKRNPKTGQWQYYAEWGVHDEWALLQQLGLDFRRVPRPARDDEPLHDCRPLVRFGPDASMDQEDTTFRAAAGGRPWA